MAEWCSSTAVPSCGRWAGEAGCRLCRQERSDSLGACLHRQHNSCPLSECPCNDQCRALVAPTEALCIPTVEDRWLGTRTALVLSAVMRMTLHKCMGATSLSACVQGGAGGRQHGSNMPAQQQQQQQLLQPDCCTATAAVGEWATHR